jgi:hypothetical protein
MSENLTGHLSPDDPGPSAITRAMLAMRSEVLQAWMDQVRGAVPQARELPLPILGNTLPAYFDTLAALLTPGYTARVVNATDARPLNGAPTAA